MSENPQTQDSTSVLRCFSQFHPKSNMILWSIHTFWYKGSAENKKQIHVREKRYISQKQQPTNQSMIFQTKTMNCTFDKWVWNVIPVPNPTQYTKLG